MTEHPTSTLKRTGSSASTSEDFPGTEASTSAPPDASDKHFFDVLEQARQAFGTAAWEEFEAGTESRFARRIQELVRQHPGRSIDAIRSLVLDEQVDNEASWEALRWLGNLNHIESRAGRLWLLEEALNSTSAAVRDGAGLGLALLDDAQAIPALRKAIQTERIPELREDLEQVLLQLEECR